MVDKDGYPRLKVNQRMWRLSRYLHTLLYGPIPDGMVVAHSCNEPACLNPEHFYLCTPQQNSADAARDRLYRYGKANHKTRWSDEEIIKMMNLYDDGMTQREIGTLFNIKQERVSECIRRARKLVEYADER
jgi:hypothetical protein